VQAFGRQIQGAEVALFYYAGHGLQIHGANYLAPVDANPTREADLDFQMLDANLVLHQMEGSGSKLNVMILDACRNNPFAGRGMRAANGGLAQMQAPEGTLISFATQPGNVALDGADGDSPYSKALAETLRQPGLDIFRTFNQIGVKVSEATGGQQQPWLSTSPIKGDFYFAGKPGGAKSGTADEAGKLAALQSRLAELERKLDTARDNPPATAPDTSKPDTSKPDTVEYPFDGRWKVTIDNLSGCLVNSGTSYHITVDHGLINEPKQKVPKKGAVSSDGHFSLDAFRHDGRLINSQKGTLSGNSGTGKFIGSKPGCTGTIRMSKVN
jgi:hypothetical protein